MSAMARWLHDPDRPNKAGARRYKRTADEQRQTPKTRQEADNRVSELLKPASRLATRPSSRPARSRVRAVRLPPQPSSVRRQVQPSACIPSTACIRAWRASAIGDWPEMASRSMCAAALRHGKSPHHLKLGALGHRYTTWNLLYSYCRLQCYWYSLPPIELL